MHFYLQVIKSRKFENSVKNLKILFKNSQVKEVNEEFMKDEHNYRGKMRIGTALALQEGFLDLGTHLDEIDVPFLCIFGDKDFICDAEGADLLLKKSPQKDKEKIIYKDQYHDLLWEPKKDDVFNDTSSWIEKRIK